MGHTSFQLDRRAFLRAGLLGAGALVLGPGFMRRAFAAGPVTVGAGPYGALGPFDANGIALPPGFTSREVARGGEVVPAVGSSGYTWHRATDGQATFPTLGPAGAPDGGWILVANSEVSGTGGVSAIEFSAAGDVERAYRILDGTSRNCAGGPTPWGTWLSCEEHAEGLVWECDPAGTPADAVARPALGVFCHEAACVDPLRGRVYLTEDEGDGGWYRFTPDAYPDLSSGLLEVAVVAGADVAWVPVPDPAGGAVRPTRTQVPGSARFAGGEGTWYDDGRVYFTTKGDGRVWVHDIAAGRLEILYDPATAGPEAPLSGVDNITVSRSGDVFVCEDGGDHDICLITPDFAISRFLRLDPAMHGTAGGNETVGVVFSPEGGRMYFGAQRSFDGRGVVYEIRGPFRDLATPAAEAAAAVVPAVPAPEAVPATPPVVVPAGAPAADAGDPVPAIDVVAPGVKLGLPRRASRARVLRRGLPVTLEVDEPAGIRVRLDVTTRRAGRRPVRVPIARAEPTVAVDGSIVLRLRPSARAARRLRRRSRTALRLTVVVTDRAGNARVVRRRLTIA